MVLIVWDAVADAESYNYEASARYKVNEISGMFARFSRLSLTQSDWNWLKSD